MKKIQTISTVFLVALLVIPQVSLARHNDNNDWGGWSRSSIDRDELDDDIVDNLPIPVLFGVVYDLVNPDFGDPRGGGTRSHEGQDFIAAQKTPVVSPTEAIVIRTGEGTSAGKYVYTANPGGETFRYMHLDSIADIESGDKLDVGDLIGTVGDTGNAPDGVYHLHFEVRDEDNDATDPYERLVDGFTLEEKISFLDGIFDKVDEDEDEYAEFLVDTYGSDIRTALSRGYDLPDPILDILEESGVLDEQKAEVELEELLARIPAVISSELDNGDQSPLVALLQIYIIYTDTGAARNALAAAGPTGYYGGITARAVEALQAEVDVSETGVYDEVTRKALINRTVELSI